MLSMFLSELQCEEQELSKICSSINELVNKTEIHKYKNEFLRLRGLLEKCEDRLKTNGAQLDIKLNEINNLQHEKTACGDIITGKDITQKKHDKINEVILKIDKKITVAESQLITLKEERNGIDKEVMELKKKLSYIKRKYSDIKIENDNQIDKLRNDEELCHSRIKEIIGNIDENTLNIYVRVKKQHNNPISYVKERKCCGCNVELSSFAYEAIKQGTELVRCESCGRILIIR